MTAKKILLFIQQTILPGVLLLIVLSSKAQNGNKVSPALHYKNSEQAEAADERYSLLLDSLHILESVEKNVGASKADMSLFTAYYSDTLDNDLQAFFMKAGKSIVTDADLQRFSSELKEKYGKLYDRLQEIKKEFPSTIDEYTAHRRQVLPVPICNPSCTNIGFEAGTLTGWNAWDATNNSTAATISYTAPTGGPCGAVTKAAIDNTINAYKNNTTYQVAITTGAGNDPIAGPAIPIVAPGMGNYSCRLGDSSEGGSRVGFIQQTFQVAASNDNLTYKYAVLIDQATHSFGQQPYFSVYITDQTTGDTLPCGVYLVTSGGSAPKGFDSVQYTIPSYSWTDWIYYRTWTTVYVPLQNYIGHCISIQATVSDCFPTRVGPHFCYAYFDAECSTSTITSSVSSCGGNVVLTAPSGGARYLWSGPCIVGIDTNQTATVSCSGTYTVNITSADGCSDTLQDVVTIVPSMTLTTTAINGGCITPGSASVNVTGGTSPYTYNWSNGNTTSNNTGLSSGTYTITVTDSNGCTQTATAIVSNSGGLTATISSATNLSCFGGNNGSASVNVTGGTAPYTYLWNPSGQTNATASGLSAGTYTINITDANGCTGSATTVITQPAAITITISTVSASCNQSNGSATASATGGTGAYTYSWSPGGNTNAMASGLSASTYTIFVTDNNGCTQTATAIVSNSNGVTATIGNITNISCFNGINGSATVNAVGGTGPYTYAWTPTGGTNSSATGLSAGSYTITVTDANGCISVTTANITQPARLIANMGIPNNVSCNGGNNGSATVIANGGTGPYTYSWAPGGNTNSSATGLTAGTYTLTLTDNNGCTASSDIIITEPTLLTASTTTTNNVTCNGGNNGSLAVTPTGGTPAYTYLWTPAGGTNSIANGLSAGTYTITVTDSSGCTASGITIITQTAPIIITSQNTIICAGQSATLTANATGGTGPYTYSWAPGGGTGQSFTVSPSSTTTYTITALDANGCTSTSIVIVSITQITPLTVSPSVSICEGNSVTLKATGSAGTYTWQPGNLSGSTITVNPSVTTTYTVSDTTPCGTSTATVTISVYPIPPVNFISDIRQGCNPLCIQFLDETPGIITQWEWLFGDGDSSNVKNPIHCYPNPGNYTVNLTVVTNIGCSSTLNILDMINVYAHPVASFTYSPKPANIMDPTIQFTDKSTDIYIINNWWWTFGDSEDSLSTIRNPLHTYSDTGIYCARLVVMNIHGCLDTTTECIPISPLPTLYIPSAFSPNGDGLNDIFTAKGEYIKTFEMYIYDRWGMKLFYSTDIDKGWDGTVNGGSTICQEDIYVYLINVTDVLDSQHTYIGRVTLLK